MEEEEKEYILSMLKGKERRLNSCFHATHEYLCKNPKDPSARASYHQTKGALNEIRDLIRWIEEGWV